MRYYLSETAEIIKRYAQSTVGIIILINIILSCVAVVRDIALASYLGTTMQADALLMALFLPDMLGTSLLAITIVASCVPVYAKLYVKDQEALTECSTYTTILFFIGSLLVLVLCIILRESIINSFGSGFSKEMQILCLNLFIIILPIIVLTSMSSTGNSLLQVHGYFNLSAMISVVYNCVILCCIIIIAFLNISVTKGVYIIAYSIVFAVLLMVLMTWIGLFRYKIKALTVPRIQRLFSSGTIIVESLHQVMNTFIPYIVMLLFVQSILLSERYLAAHLEIGVVAGLNYAYRLAQFPIWVFVAAVGMVILPSMSKSSGLGNILEFKATFSRALWLVLIISLPLSIILHVLRVPIVSILLQRGAFNDNSVVITSGILAGYSLAIVGLAAEYICHRVYLAMGKMILPLISTFFTTIISIAINFLMVKKLGSAGLGYGLAVGATLNAGILLLIIKRVLGIPFEVSHFRVFKVIVANIFVLVLAVICSNIWSILPNESGLFVHILFAIFVVVFTGTGYIGSLRYFRII